MKSWSIVFRPAMVAGPKRVTGPGLTRSVRSMARVSWSTTARRVPSSASAWPCASTRRSSACSAFRMVWAAAGSPSLRPISAGVGTPQRRVGRLDRDAHGPEAIDRPRGHLEGHLDRLDGAAHGDRHVAVVVALRSQRLQEIRPVVLGTAPQAGQARRRTVDQAPGLARRSRAAAAAHRLERPRWRPRRRGSAPRPAAARRAPPDRSRDRPPGTARAEDRRGPAGRPARSPRPCSASTTSPVAPPRSGRPLRASPVRAGERRDHADQRSAAAASLACSFCSQAHAVRTISSRSS